jgi:hypothetical protein
MEGHNRPDERYARKPCPLGLKPRGEKRGRGTLVFAAFAFVLPASSRAAHVLCAVLLHMHVDFVALPLMCVFVHVCVGLSGFFSAFCRTSGSGWDHDVAGALPPPLFLSGA